MAEGLLKTLDEAGSGLRMLGTANATAAIAAGAAFQGFAAHPEIQQSIKVAVLIHLVGVVFFGVSYLMLVAASIEADYFSMALEERVKWEKVFWLLKKDVGTYARSAKRLFAWTLVFGGLSGACFFGGLFHMITLLIRI